MLKRLSITVKCSVSFLSNALGARGVLPWLWVEARNKKPTDGEVRINLTAVQISATERKEKSH